MNHDELASDPHERLVEVLLAEELHTARAHAALPRAAAARWLVAALVLLGLCVVVGVAVLRDEGSGADATTPPQEPESVVLQKHSEFLALAKDVVRVRMEIAKAWEPHFVAVEGAVAVLEDAQQVQAFLAAVPKLDGIGGFRTRDGSPLQDGARITLDLRDGRVLRGVTQFGESELFWLSALCPAQLEPGPLLEQLTDLRTQALTNARIAHGITFSFAELARVPTNAQAILCRPLRSGTVAQHLGRFSRLERVDQVLAPSLGTSGPITIEVPTPARLGEFAVLPNLRHLRFAGSEVTDAEVAELHTLRKLTSVRIDGGLGHLTERGHAALVSQLEALELVSVENGNAVVRAAVAASRLQRLALFGVELTTAEFADLAALPTLRDLDLTGIWWKDSHIAQLLAARTPLTRLRLRSTDITADGLRTLSAMGTLRVLDLRHEDVRTPALTELQQALPECRILAPGSPPEDPWSFDEVPGRTRR